MSEHKSSTKSSSEGTSSSGGPGPHDLSKSDVAPVREYADKSPVLTEVPRQKTTGVTAYPSVAEHNAAVEALSDLKDAKDAKDAKSESSPPE